MIPRALRAWEFCEPRDRTDGVACGSALLDGDYRTSWPHFSVAQHLALAAVLAYLKGGVDALPRGVIMPPVDDGRLPHALIYDMIRHARAMSEAPTYPAHHIFQRHYDLVVPLPSSKGPAASVSNTDMARVVSRALSPVEGGDGGPPVSSLVLRTIPLKTKSTALPQGIRQARDAPRKLHLSSMRLDADEKTEEAVRGASILLWDDVVTWGNTSEGARNLLLLAGAARVDVVSAFGTGPVMRAATYRLAEGRDAHSVLYGRVGDVPNPDDFVLEQSLSVMKEAVEWPLQADEDMVKVWHDTLGEWVCTGWPHFVPNNIPF